MWVNGYDLTVCFLANLLLLITILVVSLIQLPTRGCLPISVTSNDLRRNAAEVKALLGSVRPRE